MSAVVTPDEAFTLPHNLVDTPEADIVIQLPSEAQLSGEGYKHGLRDHPLFCWVCTNLSRSVAEELYGLNTERGLHLDNLSAGVTAHMKYEDIAQAAQNSCSSCLLLREVLIAFKGPDVFEQVQTGEVTVTYLEGTTMIVTTVDDDGDQIDSFELFTDADQPCPWPTIGPLIHTINPYMSTPPWPGGIAKCVPRNPDSSKCYDTIRNWMAFCKQEHEWCDIDSSWHNKNRVVRSPPPKRLVYVGEDDSELRLCEIEKGYRPPTYLVLSYCWGSNRRLVTRRSNLEQLKTSLPFEKLAKTCQDAVTITRRLGFKYIWIDSFCIIQDDKRDWEVESAAMGAIYSNAYLCIAASAAPDSNVGILQERAGTKTLSIVDVRGQGTRVYARKELKHSIFDWRTSDPTGNQFESSEKARLQAPLFRRGWAFQERLLSLRILHYTQSEMVWECLGSTSCECGTLSEYAGSGILQERRYISCIPRDIEWLCDKLDRVRALAARFGHGRPEGHGDTNASFMDFAMRRDYTLWLFLSGKRTSAEDAKLQAGDRWHDIVSEYSRRALTFSADVLPALSGLASKWFNINGKDGFSANYLGGLWRNNIQRDLLWKYKDTLDVDRPVVKNAPTWSWAANCRAVGWIEAHYESEYRTSILKASCNTGTNIFGHVTAGNINLRGPALEGKVVISHNLRQSSFALVKFGQNDGKNEHQFHVDCIPECEKLEDEAVIVLWFCIDVQDKATQQGVHRALVLYRESGVGLFRPIRRIGVMERFDAHRLVGWQDRTFLVF